MPDPSEAERIAQVYQSYRTSRRAYANVDGRNPGNSWMYYERLHATHALLREHGFVPLGARHILDVGCGSGEMLASLLQLGARPEQLWGVDLLNERITAAQRRYPDLHFHCVNAEQLPFATAQFDLILVFTVFSSILDATMRHNIAREITRTLNPDGAIIWYDFRYNNPQNPHVRGVTRPHIQSLFPAYDVRLRTLTLLPLLARRLGRLTPRLYPLLSAVPLLRTHYLGLLARQSLT